MLCFYAMLSIKRMSMAAAWARVALPCGASVVSLAPVIMPLSTAQDMASTAQELTLPASVYFPRPAEASGSPA